MLRLGIDRVRWLLAAVFAASLAYSVWLVETDRGDVAFFDSFARFWEIALGGLLAVGALRPPRNGLVGSAMGLAGLAAIVASMAMFTGQTRFPGLAALVPTLGAAAVIMSGRGPAAWLLSSRPMVGVGLISYSLYLWHWPLFVLVEYTVIGPGPGHFLAAIAASLALATASFFWIERPVRTRRAFRSGRTLASGFAASTALVLASAISVTDGAPERFPGAEQYETKRLEAAYAAAKERRRSICWVPNGTNMKETIERCLTAEPGKSRILLVGDSHAAQFYPAIKAELAGSGSITLLAIDSCRLARGRRDTCNALIDWLEERVASRTLPFDHAIVTARLADVSVVSPIVEMATLLSTVTRVTVLGPIQFYKPNLPTLYQTTIGSVRVVEMERRFSDAVRQEQFDVDFALRERFHGSPVNYVSLLKVTCPTGKRSCTHLDADNLPITFDNTHLTEAAARWIVKEISPELRQ